MNEATVTINGVNLNPAEVSSLRVAVSSFRGEMLGPNPLGNDALGIALAKGYADSLRGVERLLVGVGR